MNDYITLSETLKALSDMNPKSKPTLGGYCKKMLIPSKMDAKKGIWLIKSDFVTSAIKWRKTVTTIDDILSKYPERDLHPKQKAQVYKSTSSFWKDNAPYAHLFSGTYFILLTDVDEVEEILFQILDDYEMMNNEVSLSDAANQLNMSLFQLTQRIKHNKFPAKSIKNRWFIKQTDIDSYLKNKGRYLSVNDSAIRIARKMSTLFDPENRYHIAYLNTFLSSSPYRNYIQKDSEVGILSENHHSLYFPAQMKDEIENYIEKYFRLYGKRKELDNIMSRNSFWDDHPETKKALDKFSDGVSAADITLLKDILMQSLNSEIMNCNNEDIKMLQECASDYSKVSATRVLSKFLNFIQSNYTCKYTVKIHLRMQNKKSSTSTLAYSLEDYLKMSYMVFNDDFIESNNMVSKAMNDPKCSYVWFYCAMHFVCAWRKSDIDNSVPILPANLPISEIKKRVRAKSFSQEATKLSLQLQGEVNGSNIAPSKTRKKQKERFLLIYIPTSLQDIFGVIYAIYCHHVANGTLKSKALTATCFIKLFGNHYKKIFGTSIFLNRRANKSYLDTIADNTNTKYKSEPSMLGYVIAQYARAHVSGSEATSRYLSTKMDGYSINDILVMLFEAGFCSFMTNYLLQMVYGERYEKLTVKEQNSLIQACAFDAYTTEKVTTLLDTAYNRSQSTIKAIFHQYTESNDKKHFAEETLLNLANRTAVSKIPGISCLCAAQRLACPYPNRDCFGCIYGIYEQSFFYLALEHVKNQYQKLAKARTNAEKDKIQKLLETEALPAICEIMYIAHQSYGMDISEYRDNLLELIITKGGTLNVTSN